MLDLMPGGASNPTGGIRPTPTDEGERNRWLHSATRWRVLSGQWDQDLYDWMSTYHLDPERMRVLGAPDTSSNAFRQSCRMSSSTYHAPPTPGGPPEVRASVEMTGHWRWLASNRYYCRGHREVLIRR